MTGNRASLDRNDPNVEKGCLGIRAYCWHSPEPPLNESGQVLANRASFRRKAGIMSRELR